MHVLSVSSLKGGVGKTTVALGLASAAFARGLRTLVVDLDPQCDATTGLGAVGEFETNVASVLKNPKHDVVSKAIVSSAWGKGASGFVDVMAGSPRSLHFDTPHPTIRQTWMLEEALHRVEKNYDLVIIDTPPSINALTRMAWVASDRVLIVTEPSIFSVVAADRAIRAIDEIREAVTKRVRPFGVVVNRYRPASKEQDFRVQELDTMFQSLLYPDFLEERSHLQQTQGAARPIHNWPGEAAAEVASFFTRLLNAVLEALAESPVEDKPKSKPEKKSFWKRHRRGKKGPEKVSIEQAFEQLGEPVATDDESLTTKDLVVSIEPIGTSEIVEVVEPPTITGGWNFALEFEKPESEKTELDSKSSDEGLAN